MGRKSPKKNFVKENAKHHAPKPKIDDAVPKVDDGQRIVPDKPAPTSSPAPSPRGTAAFAPSSHRRFSDPFVYAAASDAPGPGAYDAAVPEEDWCFDAGPDPGLDTVAARRAYVCAL